MLVVGCPTDRSRAYKPKLQRYEDCEHCARSTVQQNLTQQDKLAKLPSLRALTGRQQLQSKYVLAAYA